MKIRIYASCVASAAAQASKPWRDFCGADSRLHGEHFSERAHGATRLSSAAAATVVIAAQRIR
jgi:hypothetical protein